MRVTRTFTFANRPMHSGEIGSAITAAIEAAGLQASEARFRISEYLPEGTRTSRDLNFSELENIPFRKESISAWVRSDNASLEMQIYVLNDELHLELSTTPAKFLMPCRDIFQSTLLLEPPQKPAPRPTIWDELDKKIESAIAPLIERMDANESTIKPVRRLTAFLSFRFSDTSELLALRIQQFLALCDVDVVTGEAYEPRQVTEKVLSRLDRQHDFIVLLITLDGESMWTRDEIGMVIHSKIALVPIVEDGAKFEQGLFGNVEYIKFASGHIGDAFLKLIQAVRFVRGQSGG